MIEPGKSVRDASGRIGEVIDWAGNGSVWVLWDDSYRAKRVSVEQLQEI